MKKTLYSVVYNEQETKSHSKDFNVKGCLVQRFKCWGDQINKTMQITVMLDHSFYVIILVLTQEPYNMILIDKAEVKT